MTSDEAARTTNQCLLHEGPLLVVSGIERLLRLRCAAGYLGHRDYFFVTTMIVTRVANIWETVAKTGKMSVFGPAGFSGTNTSEPGSGLGSLWTSSARTRVRTRPLA